MRFASLKDGEPRSMPNCTTSRAPLPPWPGTTGDEPNTATKALLSPTSACDHSRTLPEWGGSAAV